MSIFTYQKRSPRACLLTRRLPIVFIVLLLLAVVATKCNAQGTMTYTFEGTPSGTLANSGAYLVPGMEFYPGGVGSLWLSGGGVSGHPDNGSGYLFMPDGYLSFMSPGNYFRFISFDAAEYANSLSPITLAVIGFPAMSSPVTNYFTLDGINDGTGPQKDFQTFYLSTDFINLLGVSFSYGKWSVDNVVVSGVPEPTTGSLALVGAGGAVAWSRFRRKHRNRQTHA